MENNLHYDEPELSDLLIRLQNTKGGVNMECFVYNLLSNFSCKWDDIIQWHKEHKELNALKNAVPMLFTDFESLPLMINRITDKEDETILNWRLELGK